MDLFIYTQNDLLIIILIKIVVVIIYIYIIILSHTIILSLKGLFTQK